MSDFWLDTNSSPLSEKINDLKTRIINAYRANPTLIEQDYEGERQIIEGGYGTRQIFELVQNGADQSTAEHPVKVEVVLTEDALYCANEGDPVDADGLTSLLHTYISRKSASQIGRFGLGFKSVLGVGKNPEFYSRSISFKFDTDQSKTIINEIDDNGDKTPSLKLAFVLNPEAERQKDEILDELMVWADTVVKVPITEAGSIEWLKRHMNEFPVEFSLFAPALDELSLHDRTINGGMARKVKIETHENPNARTLTDNQNSTTGSVEWRIFERSIKNSEISDGAKSNNSRYSTREEIPIAWAVPLQVSAARGRFWSFFPLNIRTTLKGIVNAPWNITSDRNSMIDGQWNTELLYKASELVADNLKEVTLPDDPGIVLDILPSRGNEEPTELAMQFVQQIHKLAAETESIPDQNGQLLHPNNILLTPNPDMVSREAAEIWAGFSGRPKNWSHYSVQSTNRHAAAQRLMNLAKPHEKGEIEETVKDWLEALVIQNNSVEASQVAIRAAARCLQDKDNNEELKAEIKEARIILNDKGSMSKASEEIFLPGPFEDENIGESRFVHKDLVSLFMNSNEWETLGIGVISPERVFRVKVNALKNGNSFSEEEWTNFWRTAQGIDTETAASMLLEQKIEVDKIKVRTLDGVFTSLNECLLQSELIDIELDAPYIIDQNFHQGNKTIELLKELGAARTPDKNPGGLWKYYNYDVDDWFKEYMEECKDNYLSEIKGNKPYKTSLRFDPQNGKSGGLIAPLQPLTEVCDITKAELTETLMSLGADVFKEKWMVRHNTNAKYIPKEFESPFLWLIKSYGMFKTSRGIAGYKDCVGPGLNLWKEDLNVVENKTVLDLCELPDTLEAYYSSDDVRFLDFLKKIAGSKDDEKISLLYGELVKSETAAFNTRPPKLFARVGDEIYQNETEDVIAVKDEMAFQYCKENAIPVLYFKDKENHRNTTETWKLRDTFQYLNEKPLWSKLISQDFLLQKFSGFKAMVDPGWEDTAYKVCEELTRNFSYPGTGYTDIPVDLYYDQHTNSILVNSSVIADSNETDVLSEKEIKTVADFLGIPLDPLLIQELQQNQKSEELRHRIKEIQSLPTYAEKLLKAIGEDNIKSLLPKELISLIEKEPDFGKKGLDYAKVAEATFGLDLLREYKDKLKEAGFSVPEGSQWIGTNAARDLAKDLGFEAEYAPRAQPGREDYELVYGRRPVPDLHDYQEEISGNVKKGIRSKKSGLLSMPTGSGKTRVAVQSLIDLIKDDAEFKRGTILWIAQTDELCEQAVGTFQEIWRDQGNDFDMRISRLWADRSSEEYNLGPHIVVATISKMEVIMDDKGYDWLKSPFCLVIDEAHHATTTSYSRLLRWTRDRGSLLGLTATAFRGSPEQTRILAETFQQNRYEEGVLDNDTAYPTLIKGGYLANPIWQKIPGVQNFVLSPKEKEQFESFPVKILPTSVEDKIAKDLARNRALIEKIKELFAKNPDLSVLIYAVSVRHAKMIAANLSYFDIPSRSIDGTTHATTRRSYIEKFRSRELKVLTNHSVLTEGFDAPGVDAVFIARPTFSANIYAQMAGRGLRGPKNGGKETCEIWNVDDGFENITEKLIFNEFPEQWHGKTV